MQFFIYYFYPFCFSWFIMLGFTVVFWEVLELELSSYDVKELGIVGVRIFV